MNDGYLNPPDSNDSVETKIAYYKRKQDFLTDLMIVDSRIKELTHDLEQLQELIHLIQNKGKHRKKLYKHQLCHNFNK